MCGGHQRTLSNRRLPSSQSKPTAVDRQKDFSINYGKRPPEPPKSNKKEKKLNQWGVSTWCLPSQPSAFACKHAPAHLSTRQITGVGRPRTSTPSTPHVHTNFAWFQSYSTRNLRTRSGHPPEVASQLMHPSQVANPVFFSLGVCENNSSLFFLSLAKLCRLKFTFTEQEKWQRRRWPRAPLTDDFHHSRENTPSCMADEEALVLARIIMDHLVIWSAFT